MGQLLAAKVTPNPGAGAGQTHWLRFKNNFSWDFHENIFLFGIVGG